VSNQFSPNSPFGKSTTPHKLRVSRPWRFSSKKNSAFFAHAPAVKKLKVIDIARSHREAHRGFSIEKRRCPLRKWTVRRSRRSNTNFN